MMKISTRGRYATRAMIELASRGGPEPIQLRQVAKAQGISGKYLEQLLAALKRGKLVKSVLGARGGYVLSKPASEITVLDIVEAVEGCVAPVHCVDDPSGCDRLAGCVMHELWSDVRDAVVNVLQNTTLERLTERDRQGKETARSAGS